LPIGPKLPAMNKSLLVCYGVLALAGVACNNDPAKGKTRAAVGEATATSQQTLQAPANGANYSFSQAGSSVDFVGAKVTKKHDGKIGAFNGVVQLIENDPVKSSVRVELDLDSLSVDEPKLAKHLKSPDFFDVAKFPKASFQSTSIKAGGENGATHTVTGNLDLHGVKKQISFPARIKVNPERVQVEAEFAINRKDFGINYPGMADDLIKDDVLILLKLDAKKS
jgi:polyisoprenoid-binding protein YceI